MKIKRFITAVLLATCLMSQGYAASAWYDRLNPMNVNWSQIFTHRVGYPATAFAGGTVASFLTYHVLKSWYDRQLKVVELKAENRILKKALTAMSRQGKQAKEGNEKPGPAPLPKSHEEAEKQDRAALARHNLLRVTDDAPTFQLK
jgi:hypothetical protein